MAYSVGETLQAGKYHLKSLLEERPWGMTFLATYQGVNQPVIIKTYRGYPQAKAPVRSHLDAYSAFAQKLIRFHHPRLSRVIHEFQEAEQACMVSEFIPGMPLSEVIQAQPLPETQAIDLIKQVSQGLYSLHRHGLMHLNLRPSRILQRKGTQEIVLIGLNSRFSNQDQAHNPYLALEQHQASDKVGLATEIYSIAATLYTLVTGHCPTPASERWRDPLLSPNHWRPELSEDLEHAIMRGLAIEPRDRPQNIKAWLSLLPSTNPLQDAPALQVPPAWDATLPLMPQVSSPAKTTLQAIPQTQDISPEAISTKSASTDQRSTASVNPELDAILADLTPTAPAQSTRLQVPATQDPSRLSSGHASSVDAGGLPPDRRTKAHIPASPITTLQVKPLAHEAGESSDNSTEQIATASDDSSSNTMVATPSQAKTSGRFPKWTLFWCAVLAGCGGLGFGLWVRMKWAQPVFSPEPTVEQTPLEQFRTLDSRQEDFLPTPNSVIPEATTDFSEEFPSQQPAWEGQEHNPAYPDSEYAADLENPIDLDNSDPLSEPGFDEASEIGIENVQSFPETATTNTDVNAGFDSELEPEIRVPDDLETQPQDQTWYGENLAEEIPPENFGTGRELIYDPTTNTF